MKHIQLTFIQTFNAMRIFFNMRYGKTHSDQIGTLCGDYNLWKDKPNWKENPETFDPAAWRDWMKAVHQTLQEFKIDQDPKKMLFDEEIAFLCVEHCLQAFYEHTPWEDIHNFYNELKYAKHIESDLIWNEWLQAIDHAVHETYELDMYFDPFTGERIS